MKKDELKTILRKLPKRKKKSNKSDFGKTLIIAGNNTTMGAAILSSLAASRVGSGYTYLITDKSRINILRNPDFILLERNLKKYDLDQFECVAVGPGLGTTLFAKSCIKWLLRKRIQNVVLDADALNSISKWPLKKLPATWILTPHEAELSRLIKKPVEFVKKNRKWALKLAAKKYGCSILLKGFETLIADGERIVAVSEGSPALAKAGTGDVLTGMIAGLVAQGLSAPEAAQLACVLQGRASKNWLKSGYDESSLMPSDLLLEVSKVLRKLKQQI